MLHGIVQEVSPSPIGYLVTFIGPDGRPDLDLWSSRLMADLCVDQLREDGCTSIVMHPIHEDRELRVALAEIDARDARTPPVETGEARLLP